MDIRILEKLTCPSCAGGRPAPKGPAETGPALICASCGAVYPNAGGILDFAGPAKAPRVFSTQWAMEFGPLVALYERLWRPLVTLPVSSLKWEMETAQELLALSPRLLEKSGMKNIVLMRADVTKWPFAAGSFDRVHCAGGLHLCPDLPGVFASVRRSLREGGVFVGATYCRAKGGRKKMMQNYVSSVHGFHWFRPDELRELAERAGFSGWEQRVKKQGIVFRAEKG
jgi:SAM-dependent methyltransferase